VCSPAACEIPCPPEDVCDPILVDPLDPIVTCIGPTFTMRLDTGVGPDGAPLAAGAVDPEWRIWVAGATGAWITPNATGIWGPRGYYTYERPFTVPSNAYDVRVDVTYAADNQVRFFDRAAVVTFLHESATHAFGAKTSFSYTLTETGSHALAGRLFNQGSYTGLLVEATVTGKCR
jgi:hypothetical protein